MPSRRRLSRRRHQHQKCRKSRSAKKSVPTAATRAVVANRIQRRQQQDANSPGRQPNFSPGEEEQPDANSSGHEEPLFHINDELLTYLSRTSNKEENIKTLLHNKLKDIVLLVKQKGIRELCLERKDVNQPFELTKFGNGM